MSVKAIVRSLILRMYKHENDKVKQRCAQLFEKWVSPRGDLHPDAVAALLYAEGEEPSTPKVGFPVDVVIPVYGGLVHLKRLIPSLFQHTKSPHRFIFVDDASPDEQVLGYLREQAEGRNDVVFFRNKENLGFAATVNNAIRRWVRSPVFVLLNTDSIVPERWLERLVAPFAQDRKIGTATPFSNNAVFFSFPNFKERYNIRDEERFLELDRFFRRIKTQGGDSFEFVNGTGFCMGIRKCCWDKFGGFDVDAFGKGYGEECDWCMRIMTYGWKNVLVPNLFVCHNHGGSFRPEERDQLEQNHFHILRERWREYLETIDSFSQIDPWARYRLAVFHEIAKPPIDVLFIDSNRDSGGACEFRKQQVRSLLKSGKRVACLFYSDASPAEWWLSFPNEDGNGRSRLNNWDEVERWVCYLQPKAIRVNSLVSCANYRDVLGFLTGRLHEGSIYQSFTVDSGILPDHPVDTVIAADRPRLCAVAIRVGTYSRHNKCILRFRMESMDGTVVAEREIHCENLLDNALVGLPFAPIQDSAGRSYRISITSQDATSTDFVVAYRECTPGRPSNVFVMKYFDIGLPFEHQLTYYFHDFLSCCPKFFSCDQGTHVCDFTGCSACIQGTSHEALPCSDVSEWRSLWGDFLSRCDCLRFFSSNMRRLIEQVYGLDAGRTVVCPYERGCGNDC